MPDHLTTEQFYKFRTDCQREIYGRLGVMEKGLADASAAVAEIRGYLKGQANGKIESGNHVAVKPRRFPWKEVAAAAVLTASAVFAGVAALRHKAPDKAEIVAAVLEALKAERAP